MNIVVLACACRTSGARIIYLQFQKHLKEKLKGNYHILIDEIMPKESVDGVKYYTFNGRTWENRMWLDFYGIKKVLKETNLTPSLIISLQNTGFWCLRYIPQLILYKYIYPLFVKIKWKKNELRSGSLVASLDAVWSGERRAA